MGNQLLTKFNRYVEYLNTDCDQTTAEFIEKNYHKFAAISLIYPVMNRDKPWSCLMYMLLLIFYSGQLFFICFIFVTTCLELYNINLVLCVHELHMLFLVIVTFMILMHSWFGRSSTAKLHGIISRNFYDYQEDLTEIQTSLREDMKIKRKLSFRSVLSILFGCFACLVITPIIHSVTGVLRNNTRIAGSHVNFDIPVPAGPPFHGKETVTLVFGYVAAMSIASLVGLINSTNIFLTIDCYLHVRLHLKLLLFQTKTIDARAEKLYFKLYGVLPQSEGLSMYSDKFSRCYKLCLRKNIEHHRIIIRAANGGLSDVSGFYIFFFYLVSIADIAMTMITVSSEMEYPGATISSIILCAIEVTFMAVFAHMGQTITNLSAQLREEIYDIPWYRCNESVKRTIRILQIVTFKPISFSFYSLLIINYDSFATVLNSAYSFYNIINAA